jgi:hypothetical protein
VTQNPYGVVGYAHKSVYIEVDYQNITNYNFLSKPHLHKVHLKKGDQIVVDVDAEIKVGELLIFISTDEKDYAPIKYKTSKKQREIIGIKKDTYATFSTSEAYEYTSKECENNAIHKSGGEFILDIFIPRFNFFGNQSTLFGSKKGCPYVDMTYNVTFTLLPAKNTQNKL